MASILNSFIWAVACMCIAVCCIAIATAVIGLLHEKIMSNNHYLKNEIKLLTKIINNHNR